MNDNGTKKEEAIQIITSKSSKSKKKKGKKNKKEEDPDRGMLAWFKYSIGLTGGVKHVNKWLEIY